MTSLQKTVAQATNWQNDILAKQLGNRKVGQMTSQQNDHQTK
jgi:hypothetical protein